MVVGWLWKVGRRFIIAACATAAAVFSEKSVVVEIGGVWLARMYSGEVRVLDGTASW